MTHDTGVVTPPGMKSRATVATIPRAKIAKIIAKLSTPQTEGLSSSSGEVTVDESESARFSCEDFLDESDSMRRGETHGGA